MNTCPVCAGERGRPKDFSGGCRCPHKVAVHPFGGVRRRRKKTKNPRVVLKPTDGDAA